jgi:hypothetical protein
MKAVMFLFALSLLSSSAPGDYSCPDGSNAACLDNGDIVCPAYAKCVNKEAVCLDESACDSARGYICGSEYDEIMKDYEKVVSQYNQLTSENVDLRETRLEQRNCVINAATLKDAIRCVRSQD